MSLHYYVGPYVFIIGLYIFSPRESGFCYQYMKGALNSADNDDDDDNDDGQSEMKGVGRQDSIRRQM